MNNQVDEAQISPPKRLKLSLQDVPSHNDTVSKELIAKNRQDAAASEGVLMVVTGSTDDNVYSTAIIHAYDPKYKQLYRIHFLTAEMILTGRSILVLRGRLYIFLFTGKLYCLDPFKSWIGRSFTHDHHDVPAVEMDGFLYVLGAENEEHGSCEKYDPIKNEWTCIGYTRQRSKYCSFIALKGWIYCICLRVATAVDPTVERFNPTTSVWEDVAPINEVNDVIFSTILNDKIYIVASTMWDSKPSTMECYDSLTNAWTLLMKPGCPCQYLGLYTVEQRCFAICRNNGISDCINIMNFDLDEARVSDQLKNISIDAQMQCTHIKLPGEYFIKIHTSTEQFFCCLPWLVRKSDYFKKMFSHVMKEQRSGIVQMNGFDPSAIRSCIDYLSTEIIPKITWENLEALLHVARALLIDGLLTQLEKFIRNNLTVDTFQKLRQICYKYDLIELEEECDRFAISHFAALVETSCFLAMEFCYVKFLIKNRNNEISQSASLKYMLRWIKHDVTERQCHVDELFSFVDLQNVKLNVLEEAKVEVLPSTHEKGRRRIRNRLDKAISKRKQWDQALLVAGEDSIFYAYFPTRQSKKWMPTSIMQPEQSECLFCFAESLNLIMINDARCVSTIRIDDPNRSWVRQSSSAVLKAGVDYKFTVSEKGILYAFGKNEAVKYNLGSDTWSTITCLESRSGFGVAASGEWIYLCGGNVLPNEDEISKTVTRYNTTDDKWHEDVAPMNNLYSLPTAAGLSEKIYVLGAGQRECEQYDTKTNVWTAIAPLLKSYKNIKTVILDCKIYVIASPHRGFRHVMTFYDPEKDEWKPKSLCTVPHQQTAVSMSLPYDITA